MKLIMVDLFVIYIDVIGLFTLCKTLFVSVLLAERRVNRLKTDENKLDLFVHRQLLDSFD